ncbi:TPA: hypothetical protein ACOEME_002343 [Enterobacter cloacae subsp. dissolvens]
MGKVALPVVPDPLFDTDPHWRMNVLSVAPLRKGIFRYPLPDKSPVIPFRLAAFPKPRFFIHHGHDCPWWPFSAVQSEMTMLDKMVASITTFLWAKNHANRLRKGVNK